MVDLNDDELPAGVLDLERRMSLIVFRFQRSSSQKRVTNSLRSEPRQTAKGIGMNASNRRHTRYTVAESSLADQKIRSQGLFKGLLGWSDCRIRDLSIAGALILTSKSHGAGDKIYMKLTLRTGEELVFLGKVVNIGTEPRQGGYRLGVALDDVKPDTAEYEFLHDLASVFAISI